MHKGADFWALVKKGSESDCWLWLGTANPLGYGYLWWKGRVRAAHSVAWELASGKSVGREKNGRLLSACHHCDNPPCCNPKHIFMGTARDNMNDAIEKGRIKYNQSLREAIKRIDWVNVTASDIARELGISRQRVHQVRTGYNSPAYIAKRKKKLPAP